MQLKYHQKTYALLNQEPMISDHALEVLSVVEQQCGFVLPPSVREWYSLEGALEILARDQDWPTPLEQLGKQVEHWGEAGPRDFLSEGYLIVLTENQGVCHWAVKLEGLNDPLVVVETDSAPNIVWQSCADSFSTWIYTLVWDWQQSKKHALSAQDKPLDQNAIRFLQQHYSEAPRTYGWPGKTTFRFSRGDQGVLIWLNEGWTDWFLMAGTSESLFQLANAVWGLGALSESLYGIDDVGMEVLRRVKDALEGG